MKRRLFIMDTGQMCNHIVVFGHGYGWCRKHGVKPVSLNFCLPQYQFFKICETEICSRWWYYVCKLLTKVVPVIPVVKYNSLEANNEENERKILKARMALADGWCIRHYEEFEEYLEEVRDLFSFHAEIEEKVGKLIEKELIAYRGEVREENPEENPTKNPDQNVLNDSLNGSSQSSSKSKLKSDLKSITESEDDIVNIGLHVRRGDYKTWCGGHYYFEDEVFVEHAKHLIGMLPGKRVQVYVCSNDPLLNKELFRSLETFYPECANVRNLDQQAGIRKFGNSGKENNLNNNLEEPFFQSSEALGESVTPFWPSPKGRDAERDRLRNHLTENLNRKISVVFPNGSGVEDLCLLSKCDYVMGPPSTFSMVSTMYGKGKVYWLKDKSFKAYSGELRAYRGFGLEDFMGFMEALRAFDGYYVEK